MVREKGGKRDRFQNRVRERLRLCVPFFFFFRVVVRKLWCVYRLINMSLDSEIFFILVRLDYLEEWEKR